MKTHPPVSYLLLSGVLLAVPVSAKEVVVPDGKAYTGKKLIARAYNSGFPEGHDFYNIPTGKYADHGAIFYENGERPLYVNSMTIGKDDTVYSLGRIAEGGKTRADLFSVPNPLKNGA